MNNGSVVDIEWNKSGNASIDARTCSPVRYCIEGQWGGTIPNCHLGTMPPDWELNNWIEMELNYLVPPWRSLSPPSFGASELSSYYGYCHLVCQCDHDKPFTCKDFRRLVVVCDRN